MPEIREQAAEIAAIVAGRFKPNQGKIQEGAPLGQRPTHTVAA